MDRAPDPFADRIATLRATFASGRTRPRAWRLQQLEAIERMVIEEEAALLAALREDLNKPTQESWMAELSYVRGEAGYARRNLSRWMAPRRVATPR